MRNPITIISSYLWALTLFVGAKLAGTTLTAWSWFWCVAPAVPLLGAVAKRLGL